MCISNCLHLLILCIMLLLDKKKSTSYTTFCSFCLITLRVIPILTDNLCVRRTSLKIKPEKELEQDFSVFSDR